LIEGIDAQCLLADRGDDTNEIVEKAEGAGMQVVIPPKKNRKVLRQYDKHLYRHRHLVENAFLHLKRWRGIATRYAKNLASFRGCRANPLHCPMGRNLVTTPSKETLNKPINRGA
jgi:transposase